MIVSLYYRLDSFGFLATPEFTDPAYGDFNVGFLDQLEALRWVNQHIRAFGGDPNRVTINGQSAGGSSVELHMVANQGQQLFHGAIAQSVYRSPLPTPKEQQVCMSACPDAVLAPVIERSIAAFRILFVICWLRHWFDRRANEMPAKCERQRSRQSTGCRYSRRIVSRLRVIRRACTVFIS